MLSPAACDMRPKKCSFVGIINHLLSSEGAAGPRSVCRCVDDFCQRDRSVPRNPYQSHTFCHRIMGVSCSGCWSNRQPVILLGDYNSGWGHTCKCGHSICLSCYVSCLAIDIWLVPLLVSSEILSSSATMDSFLKLYLIAKY